jgi:uncharacterized protein (TIGR02599 family)
MIVAFRADRMCCCRTRAEGFSLIEMLVSMAILGLIMAIVLSMTQQTSSLWKNTSGKIEGFRNARTAFDAMTRTLSQATLQTYFDYQDSSGNWAGTYGTSSFTSPAKYARRSDLHFICGQGSTLLGSSSTLSPVTHAIFFQAPLGYSTTYTAQQRLLNACGFYVAYGPDPNVPSYLATLSARYRYRLMEFLQPSESLQVYMTSVLAGNPNTWFKQPITVSYSTAANSVLAENVIALAVWPKQTAADQANGSTSLTSDYSYDSRNSTGTLTYNQLPPVVEVTMVTIDETSAIHLGNPSTAPNAAVGITSTLFTSATYPAAGTKNQLQTDLGTMESTLTASHLNYRVYQTEVAISAAKWSGVQ